MSKRSSGPPSAFGLPFIDLFFMALAAQIITLEVEFQDVEFHKDVTGVPCVVSLVQRGFNHLSNVTINVFPTNIVSSVHSLDFDSSNTYERTIVLTNVTSSFNLVVENISACSLSGEPHYASIRVNSPRSVRNFVFVTDNLHDAIEYPADVLHYDDLMGGARDSSMVQRISDIRSERYLGTSEPFDSVAEMAERIRFFMPEVADDGISLDFNIDPLVGSVVLDEVNSTNMVDYVTGIDPAMTDYARIESGRKNLLIYYRWLLNKY